MKRSRQSTARRSSKRQTPTRARIRRRSVAPAPVKRYAMDDLDRGILRSLQVDGRRQYGALAKELGVSDVTIRNRVMQMLDADVFRIFAVADPVSLGYDGYAVLLLKLSPGADPDVLGEHYRQIANVTFVALTAGHYTLLIEVVFKSHQELNEFLKEHCYGRPDIADVESLVGLKMYKNALKWGIP